MVLDPPQAHAHVVQGLTPQHWAQTAGAELLAKANASMLQRVEFGCWCTAAEVRTCIECKMRKLYVASADLLCGKPEIASFVTSFCRRTRAGTSLAACPLRMPPRHAIASQPAAQVHLICWLSDAMCQLCLYTPSYVPVSTGFGAEVQGIKGKCVPCALLTCDPL